MEISLTINGQTAEIASLIDWIQRRGQPAATALPQLPSAAGLTPYVSAKTGKVVSLNPAQFAEFYQGVSTPYQRGIRMLADTGVISYDDLLKAGISNPGHFKSRTSLRAKTVLKLSGRVQFAWYGSKTERGVEKWYFAVPPETLRSMKSFFGL